MALRRSVPALLLLWCLVCAQTAAPVPFLFVDPAPHAVVAPGAGLAVSVAVSPESGTRRVSYYWYRLDEEPLPVQLARPALVADGASSPPFGGLVPVPVEAIGPMRLLAVAEVAQGRLGTFTEFDERLVIVEPSASLEAIEFTVDKPWVLTPVGKLAPMPAVGLFSDGVARSLDGVGMGVAVRSDDERVVRVLETGQVRAVAPGKTALTVDSRGRRATLDVLVKGDGHENGIPKADPGVQQRVKSGARVALRGLASSDPDGDPLHYEWTQVRGAKVDLVGANEAIASFVAPRVSTGRLLRFRLRVTDMTGPDSMKGADSLPAYVDIWVEP